MPFALRFSDLILVLIASVWLVFIWLPSSMFWLCYDDSFYYFEIARNFAAGHFSTFDRISPTNGYHPLWMAICTLIYALGLQGEIAVQVLLSLQWVCWCVVLLLMANLARRAIGDWPRKKLSEQETASATRQLHYGIAALLLCLTAGAIVVKAFINGMESGLYVLIYVALLHECQRANADFLSKTSLHWRLGICALCVLAFLTRTDAGLMLLCLGCFCLPQAFRMGVTGIVRLTQLFLVPAIVIVLFLVTNKMLFGIPMQVSGELKREPPNLSRGIIIAVCLAIPFVAWFLLRGEIGRKFPRVKQFLQQTGWFGVFLCLALAYYFGLQTFQRLWYLGPPIAYGAMLVLIAYIDLLDGALEEAKPGTPPVAMLWKINVVLTVMLVFAAGFQAYIASTSGMVAMREANRDAGMWISEHLPQDAVLGCWDSGVLAYYTKQRVINLDGVVNSPEFLQAIRNRKTAEFLRERSLQYVVNHDLVFEESAPNLKMSAILLLGEAPVNHWESVKRWPFVFTGSTNRQMAGEKQMAVFLYRLPTNPSPGVQ